MNFLFAFCQKILLFVPSGRIIWNLHNLQNLLLERNLEGFHDYLETKRIVESARNLTIHDVIINEAKMKDTWHNIYFGFRLKLLTL